VRAAKAAKEKTPRGAPVALEYEPDMPGPDGAEPGTKALTDDELDQLVMVPLQSLAHDRAWFDHVATAKPHAAVLQRLHEYF